MEQSCKTSKTCGTCKSFIRGWKDLTQETDQGICIAKLPMKLITCERFYDIRTGKWRITQADKGAICCMCYQEDKQIELSKIEVATMSEAQQYIISLGSEWFIPSSTFFSILFHSPKAADFANFHTHFWTSTLTEIADFDTKTIAYRNDKVPAVRCIKGPVTLTEWVNWCFNA